VLRAEDLDRGLRSAPAEVQRLASSQRASGRLAAGAAVRGMAWGMAADVVDVRLRDDVAVVRNRRGDVLLELTERQARDLGHWNLRRLGDRRPNGNAPAFCRSGEGHPVWGREWCLERGFGLGSPAGWIWSRTSVDDVVFRRRMDRERLGRDVLVDVLGDVVFGRLALHALSVGHADPLRGVWIAQPDAPAVLQIYSGDVAIAELVDLNRNGRADVLYVLQPL
jgi:hypothetical protein